MKAPRLIIRKYTKKEIVRLYHVPERLLNNRRS